MKRKASDVPPKKRPFKRPYAAPPARPAAVASRGGELKNIDVATLGSTLWPIGQATAVVTLLNGVAQGTTPTSRIGRKILQQSLFLRVQLAKSPTMTGESPLRILVVQDMQANGAAPAGTDVLASNEITSPMNLNNVERFKVILDKEFKLGAIDCTACAYKWYKKFKLPVAFNTGSTGNITDITTGSLYMLTFSNGLFATTAPSGEVYTRIRFTDN